MNVDRRGSREGKKTSLRQTNKAKKHVTTAAFAPSTTLLRTTPPTLPQPQVHSEALFDCGCNLVNRQFDNDFQRVVLRAVKAGVEGLVIVPNDFEKIGNAITLCKWQPGVLYCAAGLHPNNIVAKKMSDKQYLETLQHLREHLIAPEVVALFCGLDYARDIGLKAPQEKFLNSQLKLAGELGLPVIFMLPQQNTEAVFQSLVNIIKECRTDFKHGLIHNFYGSEDQLKQFLDLDLYISISGAVTEPKYTHLKTLLEKIPKEKLLLCTDSPYLTPKNILDEHVRESRNEPSNLPSVLQACAQILHQTTATLAQTTRKNTIEFFNLIKPQEELPPTGEKPANVEEEKVPHEDKSSGGKSPKTEAQGVTKNAPKKPKGKTTNKSKALHGEAGEDHQPVKKAEHVEERKPTKLEAISESDEEPDSESNIPTVQDLAIAGDDSAKHVVYACKMCRTKLFTSDDLVAHSRVGNTLGKQCRMYFIERMDWMKFDKGEEAEGRVLCPKCETKLGRFDEKGIQCSCGELVGNPAAYKIVRSRIDEGDEGSTSESEGEGDDGAKPEKKKKKKKSAIKKTTKGNFSSFRNKTT